MYLLLTVTFDYCYFLSVFRTFQNEMKIKIANVEIFFMCVVNISRS